MSDGDDDVTPVQGAPEATPRPDEVSSDDASNDGDDDAEERPVTVDLTRAEAVTLLHISWEKEIEMSDQPSTVGVSQLMGKIGRQVGKEIYGPEMTEWLEDRQEKHKEMMEQMMDKLSGSEIPGGQEPRSGGGGFH
jgi:hypothetical protein